MQKRLFLYPWICLAMVIGIFACIGAILHMLFAYRPEPDAMSSGAALVKEAARYAVF